MDFPISIFNCHPSHLLSCSFLCLHLSLFLIFLLILLSVLFNWADLNFFPLFSLPLASLQESNECECVCVCVCVCACVCLRVRDTGRERESFWSSHVVARRVCIDRFQIATALWFIDSPFVISASNETTTTATKTTSTSTAVKAKCKKVWYLKLFAKV